MTLRQQVAEAEGWKRMPCCNGAVRPDGQWICRTLKYGEAVSLHAPPYDTSLDAIQPLIRRTFTDPLSRTTFAAHLLRIVGHDIFSLATATAEQLFRAYLAAAKHNPSAPC